MRTAVYTGTRNLYKYMVGAAKSLLIHSNVEQIYFLIEDDVFPYELPPKTKTLNVSNQTYFDKYGPNFKSEFTYMALIRIALGKIFPNLDKILSLDVDTIVNENISELWNIDISDYYIAASSQPSNCTETFLDINCGVMLMNLKKLRDDKKDDELINYINNYYEIFPEQNALNKLCQGYILNLPPDYNMNDSTDFQKAKSRKINHFAGNHEWQKYPIFDKYMSIPNNKIICNQSDKVDLDIIIPSYNDEKGLIRTLNSIYYPEYDWLHIVVIDDASSVDYTNIIKQFPLIQLIKLEKNQGPGNARRVGMQNTHSTYLTFVDCGDIILSKYCLLAVKDELDNNRVMDIYEWSWINGADNVTRNTYEPSTPGKVYRREFLEVYNILPYNQGIGSFAAEDCGINFTCYAIIDDYNRVEQTYHIQHYDLPIYKTVVNKNSLTYKDNKEFLYTALPGLVDNGIYCISLCEKAKVDISIIIEKINIFLIDLYNYFLRCVKKRPEFLEQYWKEIRRFYLQSYKKYADENSRENENQQSIFFSRQLKKLSQYIPKPNIKRFVRELNDNENLPEQYYFYY